jgi:hypothetical protein
VKVVEPAPHELTLNWVFRENDLAPYFGCDKRVKDGGGSVVREFEIDGERWISKLYYQESGIVNPGDFTHTGTRFDLDEVREYRFAVTRHPDEDDVGEQNFNAHLSPRWAGMEVEKKDESVEELDIPAEIEEAVNVKIRGSNIEFSRYHELLQAAADAVGVNDWYFGTFDEGLSNTQDAARYVRVADSQSGPIHAREGPIAEMGHLLENDRSGYRKVVQDDTGGPHQETLPGYYHTVTLGEDRVEAVFPDHDFAREIKHYYDNYALNRPKDHPLRNPKLEVSLQISQCDGKIGADQESLREIEQQLDETVHSVLAEAGIQVHTGEAGPFVRDGYWTPENVDVGDDYLYALDLTHIRQEQESVVVRYLADSGMSPIQEDALAKLVGDGGEISPKDIAEDGGWHPDSVRRALREMEDLLDREYGEVGLRSPFIAEMVYDALQEMRDTANRAVATSAKVVEAAKRGLDKTTSAFLAWAAKHDVDVADEREARMKLRMNRPEVGKHENADVAARRKIEKGFQLWKDAGRDPGDFLNAEVRFDDGSGGLVAQLLTF